MLLLFIDLTLLPFTIAFEGDIQHDIATYNTIANIQLALYFLNILICFHSAFYKDGCCVYSHKEIAKHYISGFLWIDIVSSFPYRWIEEPYNPAVEFQPLHLLRLLRTLRLIKVYKSSRVLDRLEQKHLTNPVAMGIMSLLKMSVVVSFSAHWGGCGWYLLGNSNSSSNNWLYKMTLEQDPLDEKYVAALYYAITTMMTVGYGDISPANRNERLYAIFTMLIGGGVFCYILNSVSSILLTLEGEKERKM